VSKGLTAGNYVVVTGAQQLLSLELKGRERRSECHERKSEIRRPKTERSPKAEGREGHWLGLALVTFENGGWQATCSGRFCPRP